MWSHSNGMWHPVASHGRAVSSLKALCSSQINLPCCISMCWRRWADTECHGTATAHGRELRSQDHPESQVQREVLRVQVGRFGIKKTRRLPDVNRVQNRWRVSSGQLRKGERLLCISALDNLVKGWENIHFSHYSKHKIMQLESIEFSVIWKQAGAGFCWVLIIKSKVIHVVSVQLIKYDVVQ